MPETKKQEINWKELTTPVQGLERHSTDYLKQLQIDIEQFGGFAPNFGKMFRKTNLGTAKTRVGNELNRREKLTTLNIGALSARMNELGAQIYLNGKDKSAKLQRNTVFAEIKRRADETSKQKN